jgi:hypothetical protein
MGTPSASPAVLAWRSTAQDDHVVVGPHEHSAVFLSLKDDDNDHTGNGQCPTQWSPPAWRSLLLRVISDLEHGSSPPGGTTRCRPGSENEANEM